MRPRGPGRERHRGRGLRSLKARLLLWFLGAILLAVAASVGTTLLTREDSSDGPTRVVSRHVQQRVARTWDDPAATDAYIAELRDTTGLDIRVRRDPSVFPERRTRPGGMVFEDGIAYVPVVKRGQVVGALELRTGTPAPQGWRIVAALLAALLVLGAVARRVAVRLARPLEHVASTAERFGTGDLDARTGADRWPRRWVAEEVRDLGRSFDAMADRIARVVVEQRELLAAISHELRSPLGRARIALEIARERRTETAPEGSREGSRDYLRDEPPEGGGRTKAESSRVDYLDDVDRQLVEIDAILGDLLASARAGLADLRRQEVELGDWLREQAARANGDGGEVEVEGPKDGEGIAVAVDPALLGRAVQNILANARAHGHPKELPLVVRYSAPDPERVEVRVRDRGPGFAPDILPRAFDPFVTGTGAARSPGAHGIGLGLSLVRRIVEAHGGRVWAENADTAAGEASGATVAFELPRLPGAKAAASIR